MHFLLAEDVSQTIQRTRLLFRFDRHDCFGLVFWKSLIIQLVAKFQIVSLFSQLGVGTHDSFFELIEIAVKGSGNSTIELLFGNTRQETTLRVRFRQSSGSLISLEATAWIPDLYQINFLIFQTRR